MKRLEGILAGRFSIEAIEKVVDKNCSTVAAMGVSVALSKNHNHNKQDT